MFKQFKPIQYRCTKNLRFRIFLIYSSVLGVNITKTAIIKTFGNTNWRISTLLNFLRNFL